MKKLLLLDNYDSFTYNLAHRLREVGVDDLTVVRNDKIDLSSLGDYTHIMLSPGPGLPSESGKMMEVIEATKDKASILGVCLGHQAIAESFGGKLINLESVVHGKEHEIFIENWSPLFQGLSSRVVVGRYHSWVVDPETLPSQLRVIGKTERNEIMAIAHSELSIYGVQFHPESVMTETGLTMLKNWVNNRVELSR